MDKQKIVNVGTKPFFIAISETDGKWHALVAPMPPSDGRPYTLPQWHCDAASEAELDQKIEEHFQEVLRAQKAED